MQIQEIIDVFDRTDVTIAELSSRSGRSVNELKMILLATDGDTVSLETTAECVICAEPIKPQANGWVHGHNAEPVCSGQCCDECWHEYVLPERLRVDHDD